MSYQVILFDLDDTLIDFSYSERMGLISIYNQFYTSVEYAVFEHLYKEINTRLWHQVGNSLSSSEVRLLRFAHLNQKISCPTPIEEIASEYEKSLRTCILVASCKSSYRVFTSKRSFLGIITNGFKETQAQKHQQLELSNWFDCYIISSEIGVAKPDIKILKLP